MLAKSFLGEFVFEAENTRKLLQAIPDTALDFKPSPTSWTTGQLASHIAEIYNWYPETFNCEVFDMGNYKYDKGDISKAENILAKFEFNYQKAKEMLASLNDEDMMVNWTMKVGDHIIVPTMPRIQAARSFLMNHLYHHRGEMIVYLRASGNTVPGLYGPTYEESRRQ